MKAPTLPEINLIHDNIAPRELARATRTALQSIRAYLQTINKSVFEGIDQTIYNVTVNRAIQGETIAGLKGSGLAQYMLAYAAGDLWLPAVNSNADAKCRAVCSSITGDSCAVQTGGLLPVFLVDATAAVGATLYVSATPGMATTVRPDVTTTVMYQAIGFSFGVVVDGIVMCKFNPNLEPIL
jgi:hypothetical protein